MQPYDRTTFIAQVQQLLHDNGMDPQRQAEPTPEKAADMMLNSLGLRPTISHIDALKKSLDAPWPDEDDARAQRTQERLGGRSK